MLSGINTMCPPFAESKGTLDDVPQIWADNLEQHKADVRAAVMATAAELASSGGVRDLTMSQIAQQAGISRATLYTYFSNVDEILRSWHRSLIDQHLTAIEHATHHADPKARLAAACESHIDVLATHQANTTLQHHHTDADTLAGLQRLHQVFEQLVAAALPTKIERNGLTTNDYTHYLLAALEAAPRLRNRTAQRRLVDLVTHRHPN